MKRMAMVLLGFTILTAGAQTTRAQDALELQPATRPTIPESPAWLGANQGNDVKPLTPSLSPSDGERVPFRAGEGQSADSPHFGGSGSLRLEKEAPLSGKLVKPNEIVEGKITYSGIAVACFKTDNLLQLLNPFAPARYGSGEDNTLRDPSSGRAYGWKLFSIRF